jgi:hypothetical protein
MHFNWPPRKVSPAHLHLVLKVLASGKLVAADLLVCILLFPMLAMLVPQSLRLWIIIMLAVYFICCFLLFLWSNAVFKRKKT